MEEPKEITCPRCGGTKVDPHDDGGTLQAKPPCLLCNNRGTVPNPNYQEPAPVETQQAQPAAE